ncbi:hypothetical protein JCGZ_08847 [Jatropha curcas]|uniref:Uncharacterized protein n=1 Tax=Jatropha curcas TaxID=180498 RepID=A0A067KNX7_JATCU|nr:hypothetical protein JCGZ_08847 [Jatropha curcas]
MILPLGVPTETHRPVAGPPPSMVAKKPWLLGIERSSHHLTRFSVRRPFLALVARDQPSIQLEQARQEPSATVNVTINRQKTL